LVLALLWIFLRHFFGAFSLLYGLLLGYFWPSFGTLWASFTPFLAGISGPSFRDFLVPFMGFIRSSFAFSFGFSFAFFFGFF
jgi:hypothetical protein